MVDALLQQKLDAIQNKAVTDFPGALKDLVALTQPLAAEQARHQNKVNLWNAAALTCAVVGMGVAFTPVFVAGLSVGLGVGLIFGGLFGGGFSAFCCASMAERTEDGNEGLKAARNKVKPLIDSLQDQAIAADGILAEDFARLCQKIGFATLANKIRAEVTKNANADDLARRMIAVTSGSAVASPQAAPTIISGTAPILSPQFARADANPAVAAPSADAVPATPEAKEHPTPATI